ncbi:MAG: hypothetical protein R6X02_19860 [Enhygromyxa sp.]
MRLRPILLLASVHLSALAGCQKDSSIGGAETGETGPEETDTVSEETETETESETESESETDEGSNFVPDDSETGEPEPEPKTCREMLDCVFMCLSELGLECLQTCGEGFDSAEAQKAGELVFCIGQLCVEKEQCSLSDFTTEDCIGCIGLGLFLPEPPGCEEQAMVCE